MESIIARCRLICRYVVPLDNGYVKWFAKQRMFDMHKRSNLFLTSKESVGPVLCDFIYWVLDEATKRNISTLYFLARDGYTLKEIAELICYEKKIPIVCKYIYCSRASLRIPSYHLIGKEAYDLIFQGGYHVMPRSFFERAFIPSEYWDAIISESKFEKEVDLDKELSHSEIAHYKENLLCSKTFRNHVFKISKAAYKNAVGYFRQEGALDQEHIAIVDSGWTGSMQRSLRQLLEGEGFCGKITGFYFGLFVQPHDPMDGEYVSWYFSKNNQKKNKKNKVLFCNNLFECFLSAPHGTTIGYQYVNAKYQPILCVPPMDEQLEMIHIQIAGIMEGAKERIKNGMSRNRFNSEFILRRLMGHPTRTIAETYGKFRFCDDITENYYFSLADINQQLLLKDYVIVPRLLRKALRMPRKIQAADLFWPYGNIAFISSPIKRRWYWLNIYLWQWLKYTLK